MNRYVHVAVVVVVVLLVVDIFLALQKYSKNDISCFEFDLFVYITRYEYP